VLRCCDILGKTQYEIENEYAWIDLPQLLELHSERKAGEMLKHIEVSSFPHMSDRKAREGILKQYRDQLPKPIQDKPKSAQEQYEALRARMMGR
jgi:aspartyl/asparaginyl beta-hydroxylase (cupin superfamily)